MGSLDFYQKLLDSISDGVYFVDLDGIITYGNRAAETISGYREPEAVGKQCSDIILMQVNDPGRNLGLKLCPLKKSIMDGVARTVEGYLLHKEGFLLPVAIHLAPIENDLGELVGGFEVFYDNSSEIAAFQKMKELEGPGCLDPLTEITRKKHIEIFIQSRLDEMTRYQWSFGILFIDIDRLKNINYLHGHKIGDQVIRMVSKTLAINSRSFDLIGRCGGQQFILVLTNTNKDNLFDIAERMRKLILHSKITIYNRAVSVTVSIGATISRQDDSAGSIVQRAEEAMHKSKSCGRNCVTIEF